MHAWLGNGNMRRYYSAVLLSSLIFARASSVSAQGEAPSYLPIQGILTDSTGQPLDGDVSVTFSLYKQATPGAAGDPNSTAIFQESQTIQVQKGAFVAYLGDSVPLDLNIFGALTKGILFLGVAVQGEAEMQPRLQLGSAPFAAFSQSCGDSTTLAGKPESAFAAADHKHDAEELGIDLSALGIQAGEGITSSDGVVSVNFAGSGQAATAAHSDHTHPGMSIFDKPPTQISLDTQDVTQGPPNSASARYVERELPGYKLCMLSQVYMGGIGSAEDGPGGRWCRVEWNTDKGVWVLVASGRADAQVVCMALCF